MLYEVITLHATGAAVALVGIEDNKPEAIAAMQAAAAGVDKVEIRPVPARYPMGSEKQLVQVLTGKEVVITSYSIHYTKLYDGGDDAEHVVLDRPHVLEQVFLVQLAKAGQQVVAHFLVVVAQQDGERLVALIDRFAEDA